MPIYILLKEMPYDEMLGWLAYFEKRPVGWREDLRASYLMKSNGSEGDMTKIFPSLAAVSEESVPEKFKGINRFIQSATGGDSIPMYD